MLVPLDIIFWGRYCTGICEIGIDRAAEYGTPKDMPSDMTALEILVASDVRRACRPPRFLVVFSDESSVVVLELLEPRASLFLNDPLDLEMLPEEPLRWLEVDALPEIAHGTRGASKVSGLYSELALLSSIGAKDRSRERGGDALGDG